MSPADISWPLRTPNHRYRSEFDRAEYGIEEGGLPLEHACQIKADRPRQSDDEREKDEVFQPAHRILSEGR